MSVPPADPTDFRMIPGSRSLDEAGQNGRDKFILDGNADIHPGNSSRNRSIPMVL